MTNTTKHILSVQQLEELCLHVETRAVGVALYAQTPNGHGGDDSEVVGHAEEKDGKFECWFDFLIWMDYNSPGRFYWGSEGHVEYLRDNGYFPVECKLTTVFGWNKSEPNDPASVCKAPGWWRFDSGR